MLIDARPQLPAAMPSATLRPTPGMLAPAPVGHTAASVHELVNAAGLLVAELGVCAGARWAEASSGVAATAATLRSAVSELSGGMRPLDESDPIDAALVPATAAPVVRAREIGFLASRLAHVLDVRKDDQIHATMTSVGNRLKENLRMLRDALEMDVLPPRDPAPPVSCAGDDESARNTLRGSTHAVGSPSPRATVGRA